MKKILGMFLATMISAASVVNAMEFSEPIEIGKIAASNQSGGGFWIDALDNSGTFWNSGANFDKGIARFDDSLFCHYNYSEGLDVNFGSEDFSNTVIVPIETYTVGATNSISVIPNDEQIPIYVVYALHNNSHVTIIGKINGQWIKFIDSKDISRKFFGNDSDEYNLMNGIMYQNVFVRGDSIVMIYGRFPTFYSDQIEGEFRFKWDESAQWFSVEQVPY